MVVLTNAVDTFVNEANPTKNYGTGETLHVKPGSGTVRRSFIHFGRPGMPLGATVLPSKLRLRNDGALTTTVEIQVQRISSKWKVNRVTWSGTNAQPTVAGPIATLTIANAPHNTLWEVDVTAIMQEVANGAPWYGFRIITTGASGSLVKKFYSAQASNARRRPTLEINWVTSPVAPSILSPGGGRAVDKQYPELTFDFMDPAGAGMIAAQIQIAATEAELGTATDYDTGILPITNPTFYTDPASAGYVVPPGGAWAGITAGTVRWWRAKVQRADGQWSEFGPATSFTRVAKPVPVITNPAASPNNFVWEPTPPFSWTVTGQVHYQVLVVNAADTTQEFWNTGKITSTTGVATPDTDALSDTTLTYREILRIWDAVPREQNGTSPVYAEVTRDFTYNHDNTVTGVSAFAIATNYTGLPIARLTWTRATAPDSFVIRRDGIVIAEKLAADLLVSGTSYAFIDVGASAREQHTWQVLAVVNNRQSNPSSASGTLSLIAPMLLRPDGTDPVMILNPKRDRQHHDTQALHEVMADDTPPILITQSIGGMSGHVEGLLSSEAMPGVATAKQFRDRMKAFRKEKGAPLMLFLGDETFRVSIFNVDWDYNSTPANIDYNVKFDWVVA